MSTMRIGGLASGIDTDTAVKQMMTPYRSKVDTVKQSRDLMKFKQDVYRDVLKDIRGLYTKYFDITSSANSSTNLLLSKNYQTVSFESSSSGVVTAKGKVGASTGAYKVTVEQMASPDSLVMKVDDAKLTATNKIKLNFGAVGKEVEVNLTKDGTQGGTRLTGSELVSAINGAIDSYNSVAANTNKIDVAVKYSELGNNITIQSRTMGHGATFTVSDGTGADITNALTNGGFTTGKNAIIDVVDPMGNTGTKQFAGNIFTVDGVEYTLNGVSPKDASNAFIPTTLTGTTDTKATIDNIKSFVTDYNNLIEKITTKLSEKVDRAYKPLTDDQKEAMKDDDIKLWNEKVKQGQLRNDPTLTTLVNDVLNIFSSKLGASTESLKEIGITPNPDYRTQKGQIILDEDKLTKALSENGDIVKNLLTDSDTGAFQKLKTTLYNVSMKSDCTLLKKAGYEGTISYYNNNLTKSMDEKQKLIDSLEQDLATREQGYYSKFASFEQAMNKLESQKSWFSSQMGGQ